MRFDVPRDGHHRVRKLRSGVGELSFEVDVAGVQREVWFHTDAPVTPTADAALAVSLMPAMRAGGTLTIYGALSPRLLRTQREYQAVQEVWSSKWSYALAPLRPVDVRASYRPPTGPPYANRGVATFFSGGVDSWSTAIGNPDLTHLIFVRGMDITANVPDLVDLVEMRLRDAAATMGRELYVVDTNLREFSEQLIPWEVYFGCSLAAVALLLAPLFERVLIAGDSDYEVMVDQGANPLVDHLWSSEDLEVVHAGARFSRVERLGRIANDPVVQRTLRVCWENRDGAYNCGRCRKCLMTMITLEALGVRKQVSTFPPELPLNALREVEITQPVLLTLWQDILDLILERGRADLEPPVAGVVARAKQTLGLPASYRRRTGGAAATDARISPAGHEQSASEEELRERLDTVLNSRSWRLTRPLGAFARFLRSREGP